MRKVRRTDTRVMEYLRRKDPSGYYVIPARIRAVELIRGYFDVDIVQVDAKTVLLRTRSRKTARKLLEQLASKGLLLEPD